MEDFRFTETGPDSAVVDFGSLRFELTQQRIRITAPQNFILENRIGKTDRHFPGLVSWGDTDLRLAYSGMEYGLTLAAGHFDSPEKLRSEDGCIEICFD
jgi:hypothetical protein